jgi:hypothetical protein
MPCRQPVGDARTSFPTNSFSAQFPLDDDFVTLALADFNRNHGSKRKFIELLPSEQSQILLAAQRIKASGSQRRHPEERPRWWHTAATARLWFRRKRQLSLPFSPEDAGLSFASLSKLWKRCGLAVSRFFGLMLRYGVRP